MGELFASGCGFMTLQSQTDYTCVILEVRGDQWTGVTVGEKLCKIMIRRHFFVLAKIFPSLDLLLLEAPQGWVDMLVEYTALYRYKTRADKMVVDQIL